MHFVPFRLGACLLTLIAATISLYHQMIHEPTPTVYLILFFDEEGMDALPSYLLPAVREAEVFEKTKQLKFLKMKVDKTDNGCYT
jgi:hypothetical protein